MFQNFGMTEIILILGIALIIFGPRKLPEIGRSLGKTINEFRRASLTTFNNLDEDISPNNNTVKQEARPKEEMATEAKAEEAPVQQTAAAKPAQE